MDKSRARTDYDQSLEGQMIKVFAGGPYCLTTSLVDQIEQTLLSGRTVFLCFTTPGQQEIELAQLATIGEISRALGQVLGPTQFPQYEILVEQIPEFKPIGRRGFWVVLKAIKLFLPPHQ